MDVDAKPPKPIERSRDDGRMYPCPCCGYKTLSERACYMLCPVCWWEDEGLEPWEYSGPNNQTLVEAQEAYLAERRSYRRRPGKVRAPKRNEARDPGWHPYELSDEVRRGIADETLERQRAWDEEALRDAERIAADPEGPFKEYNAGLRALEAEASSLTHPEIRARLQDLTRAHGMNLAPAHLELLSHMLEDERFYCRHPVQGAWWLLRHARPGTFRRRWSELRSGGFHFAG